jgi:hypothetical protein
VSTSLARSSARSAHVVWAKLCVSQESERQIHKFFVDYVGLNRGILISDLHVTVYHARRPLLDLSDYEEGTIIEIDPVHLRFMVMAPGGENPRPDVDPSTKAIGVRIKRKAPGILQIRALRAKFYPYETPDVLGKRRPSNHTRSAFGARHFQPHITLIKKGCGIDRDLTKIGEAFRAAISPIRLDRFVVRCRSKPAVVG